MAANAEDIKSNYNEVGSAIIELMYTENYLSIGGESSTDRLATMSNLPTGARVLDVGCGIGGPALHLAHRYDCHVSGLDLVESNIAQCVRRASERGLGDRTHFRQGDALAMPYDDHAFDVVWGQDAWCHVPDKPALIRECARVVKRSGTIAFTDWVAAQPGGGGLNEAFYDAAATPNLFTREDYTKALEECGLTIECNEDISADFNAQYRDILARLHEQRATLEERYSEKVYAIVEGKNAVIGEAFQSGALGGALIVARA
ncbi:MAG: methyltransferase domain-containing protein [Pseudomonadota bacterium]